MHNVTKALIVLSLGFGFGSPLAAQDVSPTVAEPASNTPTEQVVHAADTAEVLVSDVVAADVAVDATDVAVVAEADAAVVAAAEGDVADTGVATNDVAETHVAETHVVAAPSAEQAASTLDVAAPVAEDDAAPDESSSDRRVWVQITTHLSLFGDLIDRSTVLVRAGLRADGRCSFW